MANLIGNILNAGDFIQLKHNIEQNDDDGEYGYYVNSGEIGEIKYLIPSHKNENDVNKLYMVKFSDDKSKQGSLSKGRYVNLTEKSFVKINK